MKSYKRFCWSVKQKSRTDSVNTTANGTNKWLVLHVRPGCGSLSITTPVSLLANGLDIRSELHVQINLADVNYICVIYEAMDDCKNLKVR